MFIRTTRFTIQILAALLCLLMPTAGIGAIPSGYQSIADAYAIPPNIFYAIALTESGMRVKRKILRPWPWTLNISGMPRRYVTRKAAYQALRYYLSRGIRSIDIGLMILAHSLVTKKDIRIQYAMLDYSSRY